MGKSTRSGLAIGLNKGFITTELGKKNVRARPSRRRGVLGKRTDAVRRVVSEVCGFAPYEKRVIELIKSGQAKDLKKASKVCASRLGTNRRAKIKKIKLENIVRAQRKKH